MDLQSRPSQTKPYHYALKRSKRMLSQALLLFTVFIVLDWLHEDFSLWKVPVYLLLTLIFSFILTVLNGYLEYRRHHKQQARDYVIGLCAGLTFGALMAIKTWVDNETGIKGTFSYTVACMVGGILWGLMVTRFSKEETT